jgi:hypothetical protein
MTTTMLIGFYIGRNGYVQRIPELLPTIRRLQGWTLGIGIVCSSSASSANTPASRARTR